MKAINKSVMYNQIMHIELCEKSGVQISRYQQWLKWIYNEPSCYLFVHKLSIFDYNSAWTKTYWDNVIIELSCSDNIDITDSFMAKFSRNKTCDLGSS